MASRNTNTSNTISGRITGSQLIVSDHSNKDKGSQSLEKININQKDKFIKFAVESRLSKYIKDGTIVLKEGLYYSKVQSENAGFCYTKSDFEKIIATQLKNDPITLNAYKDQYQIRQQEADKDRKAREQRKKISNLIKKESNDVKLLSDINKQTQKRIEHSKKVLEDLEEKRLKVLMDDKKIKDDSHRDMRLVDDNYTKSTQWSMDNLERAKTTIDEKITRTREALAASAAAAASAKTARLDKFNDAERNANILASNAEVTRLNEQLAKLTHERDINNLKDIAAKNSEAADARNQALIEAMRDQNEKMMKQNEQIEKDRLEAERVEKERLAKERREDRAEREKDRLEAEQREKDRLEAERVEKERLAKERREYIAERDKDRKAAQDEKDAAAEREKARKAEQDEKDRKAAQDEKDRKAAQDEKDAAAAPAVAPDTIPTDPTEIAQVCRGTCRKGKGWKEWYKKPGLTIWCCEHGNHWCVSNGDIIDEYQTGSLYWYQLLRYIEDATGIFVSDFFEVHRIGGRQDWFKTLMGSNELVRGQQTRHLLIYDYEKPKI